MTTFLFLRFWCRYTRTWATIFFLLRWWISFRRHFWFTLISSIKVTLLMRLLKLIWHLMGWHHTISLTTIHRHLVWMMWVMRWVRVGWIHHLLWLHHHLLLLRLMPMMVLTSPILLWLLIHDKFEYFKLLFLHLFHSRHLLLIHNFRMMHRTLMTLLQLLRYLILRLTCLWGWLNYCLWHSTMHRWSFGPIMILTFGAFLTDDFKWRVGTVYFGPVMINTLWISRAYFLDGWSFVPIMLSAGRSIFTYYFLVGACLSHLFHVANVLDWVVWIWGYSRLGVFARFCDCWIFEPCWLH